MMIRIKGFKSKYIALPGVVIVVLSEVWVPKTKVGLHLTSALCNDLTILYVIATKDLNPHKHVYLKQLIWIELMKWYLELMFND